MSCTPTEAFKIEPTVDEINYEAELETETDNIFDATELQPENTRTIRDSAPIVSTYSFPRFNNVYTRRKNILNMQQVHESNPSSKPKTLDRVEPEAENTLNSPNDIHQPIAIRKGTKNCTKQPLYLIEAGFGSFLDLEFHVEWSMKEAVEVMKAVYNLWIG